MSIKVANLSKNYRRYRALRDVSLEVEPGEFLALLGPSGSGKTTLLRIIAGLEEADNGAVFLEGERASARPLAERCVGFVFQHYALFRHMTVFDNVAFGLRVRPRSQRLSKQDLHERVMRLLKLVHLEGRHSQYPSELSGGQRQRVALARVLAVEPRVMLLDEPFGALDAKVRKDLRRWLRRLHDEMGITTIFVTHDQEEAMEIADRVAIMNEGRVEQIGTPGDIWNNPANAFVYDFLGNYNEFLAWKDDSGAVHLCDDGQIAAIAAAKKAAAAAKATSLGWLGRLTARWRPRRQGGVVPGAAPPLPPPLPANPVKLFVRPFELALTRTPAAAALAVTVVHINPAGALIKVEMERANGQLVQAEISKEELDLLSIGKGDTVWVKPKVFRIFD